MAAMSMAQRRALPSDDFAIPEKAPGPGSYPIHDAKHQALALRMSAGKPEHDRVVAAVARKRRRQMMGS